MKTIYKIWWIFGIGSMAITLINPSVGMFGMINLIEFFMIGVMYLIHYVNFREVEEFSNNSTVVKPQYKNTKTLVSVEAKGMQGAISGLCIFMFVFKMVIGSLLLYGAKGVNMSLFSLGTDYVTTSWSCYIISLVLNILQMYLFIKFIRNKIFKKKKKSEEIDIHNMKEVVINSLSLKCWLLLLLSLFVAFLNPYYHFNTFFNLWYLVVYGILYVNLIWGKRMIPKLKDEFVKYNAVKQMHIFLSTKTKSLLIMANFIFFIMFNVIKWYGTQAKMEPSAMLLRYSFLEQNYWVIMWISVVVDLIVAIVFSMQIWKNKFKDENE